MAVVVEGIEPTGFRTKMRSQIIDINHTFDDLLRNYEGDPSALAPVEESLKSLMVLKA